MHRSRCNGSLSAAVPLRRDADDARLAEHDVHRTDEVHHRDDHRVRHRDDPQDRHRGHRQDAVRQNHPGADHRGHHRDAVHRTHPGADLRDHQFADQPDGDRPRIRPDAGRPDGVHRGEAEPGDPTDQPGDRAVAEPDDLTDPPVEAAQAVPAERYAPQARPVWRQEWAKELRPEPKAQRVPDAAQRVVGDRA